MKVLLVNTYDRGGAAQACIRLHLGLLKLGIDSKLLLLYKANADIPASFQFAEQAKPVSFFKRLGRKAKNGFTFFKLLRPPAPALRRENEYRHSRAAGLEGVSFPYTTYDITTSPYYKEADIVNLHWVADFLDWSTFFEKNTKPVVWTLHDQNPFLGGNHYQENFYRMDGCGNPVKREIGELEQDWETELCKLKEAALQASKQTIGIVSPSRWLYNESCKSNLFCRFPHFHIPYGLDTTIFKPLDQTYSRTVLNLPKHKKILLFVADAIESNRKGYQYLEKVLQQLVNANDVCLLAVGRNNNKQRSNFIYFTGPVFDQRLMSIAYSAADLFVIPSLEDNLPNTVIESLCCGTPVAGFNIGGLPDMVADGKNGFLSETLDVCGLLATIQRSLQFNFDRQAIADVASRLYDDSVQAKKYIDLYNDIRKGIISG